MGAYKRPRGQPRAFRSAEHLFRCAEEFCCEIIACGYNVLPSKSEFCRWYKQQHGRSLSTRTVWASINKYYPEIKQDINDLISDVLVQGAALGQWNATIIIFTLKNWCAWTDRREREGDNTDALEIKVQSVDELMGEEAE